MAEIPGKTEESAEKAYAAAAAEVAPAKTTVVAVPAPAAKVATAKRAKVKKTARAKASVEAKAAVRPAAKPSPVKVSPPATPVAKALVAEAPKAPASTVTPIPVSPPKPSITELKEKIMATAKTADFTKPIADAFGEVQTRTKAAYEKGTEALTEATEFAKGNVEAIVESGKIFAAGAQDFGKTYVEEAKSAYETMTADVKEFAAIKSPTELFQLQGKIMRRNFDVLVAASSKNTESAMKLANDAFAPITGRVNLAAEKLAKVA
jgi:hypothetical protein